MAAPSSASRESITLVSSAWHFGQRMQRGRLLPHRRGPSSRQLDALADLQLAAAVGRDQGIDVVVLACVATEAVGDRPHRVARLDQVGGFWTNREGGGRDTPTVRQD